MEVSDIRKLVDPRSPGPPRSGAAAYTRGGSKVIVSDNGSEFTEKLWMPSRTAAGSTSLHRPRTDAERLHRELQRQVPGRTSGPELVHRPVRRQGKDRIVTAELQHRPPAQLAERRYPGGIRRPVRGTGINKTSPRTICQYPRGRSNINFLVHIYPSRFEYHLLIEVT